MFYLTSNAHFNAFLFSLVSPYTQYINSQRRQRLALEPASIAAVRSFLQPLLSDSWLEVLITDPSVLSFS